MAGLQHHNEDHSMTAKEPAPPISTVNAPFLYPGEEDLQKDGPAAVKDDDASDHPSNGSFAEKGFNIARKLLPPGGIAASVFNLSAATLGAGTLALPQSYESTGDVLGSVLLVLSCIATVYSIRLLIIVVERTGYNTYEEMARKLVSPAFEKLVAFFIVAFCWGCTVLYTVAIGKALGSFDSADHWPSVFKGEWGHRFITVLYWAFFMVPLSLQKEINNLRFTSLLNSISTVILVSAIIAHSAQAGKGTSNLRAAEWTFGMLEAAPVFSFSYCCQTNIFEVYAELKSRSVRKMTLVSLLAMSVCTAIYIAAGVAGYAEFGGNVDGDILTNYGLPTNTWYIAVAVVAVSVTLTTAYPTSAFPTRDSIVQLLGHADVYHTPTRTRVLVVLGLCGLSLILGLFAPKIDLLFGLLGGIFGSSLGYVLPVVFVWRSGDWTVETVGWADVIASWALLIVGVVTGIGGTIASVYSTFA